MSNSQASVQQAAGEREAHAALRLEVDQHVGKRIRLRRILLRLTQEQLGERLAVTFQQIQKYERGESRIAASRLLELCHILNVEITYFFEELLPEDALCGVDEVISQEKDEAVDREATIISLAYRNMKDDHMRKVIFQLVTSLK